MSTPAEDEEEELANREFYELALKEFESAASDQDRAEALSEMLIYGSDPELALSHADQLEAMTVRSSDRPDLYYCALGGRFEARLKLAERTGDWGEARQAAEAYYQQAQDRKSEPSERLQAILALAKLETATSSFSAAKARIGEAEALARSIPYPKDDPTDLAEVCDASMILNAHLALARACGEAEKVALLEEQLKVLDQQIRQRSNLFVEQSQARIEKIMKAGTRKTYLYQAGALVALLLIVFARPLFKALMEHLR